MKMKTRNENKSSLLFLALTYLIVNFIKKLPLVVRKNAILVVCNRLFKIVYFVATTKRTFIKRLARLFVIELTRKLNKILEIETRLSIMFYPQTNKQTQPRVGILLVVSCKL